MAQAEEGGGFWRDSLEFELMQDPTESHRLSTATCEGGGSFRKTESFQRSAWYQALAAGNEMRTVPR